MASRLYRRILHSLDNHGTLGTLHRLLTRRSTAPTDTPGPDTQHPFDLLHNTDTSGYLPGETLATGHPADLYNTAYYAISPSTLTAAIQALEIDPAHYTFVDLGCGKGRALLLAAQQGFAQVLGVELCPPLAQTARQNCALYSQIEVRTGDAATLQYPATPLVIFFYHPFLAPLLKQVLTNLTRQSQTFLLLSANPGYPNIFRGFPTLREQWTRSFLLSAEDAAHDRHATTEERYSLWASNQSSAESAVRTQVQT